MARSRTVHRWATALVALCLVAVVAGLPAAGGDPASGQPLLAASASLSGAAGAALLPARLTDDAGVAGPSTGSARALLLPIVLVGLLAIPAARRRRGSPPGNDHRLLQTRRYTIALRAPPLLPA